MKSKYWLYVAIALMLAYEAYALTTTASGDTISELVWRLSSRPLVPFAFGLLMGHFFWQSGKLSKLPALRMKWAQRVGDYRLKKLTGVAAVVDEFVADIDAL